MDWFSFGMDGFSLLALTLLHIWFLCRFTGKEIRLSYFPIYFSFICIIQIASLYYSIPWILSICAELWALYGINRYLLNNRRILSFAASMLAVCISQLSSGIVNSLESIWIPFSLRGIRLYLILIFATFFSFMLSFFCYCIALKLLSFQDDFFTPHIWLLLMSVLFFFSVELYIIQTAYQHFLSRLEPTKHLLLLSLQILGALALFCMLYAYQRVCTAFLTQAAITSLTQAAEAQKTYIAEARLRYETTQSFRHDLKNHLSVLHGLLYTDRTEEAKEYLRKMQQASISLSFPCQSGNPVVDILLSEKLALARLSNIKTEVSLLLPGTCAIDDFDLCVIFANALDNAITACQSIEDAMLSVEGEQQGDFYRLEFWNTCRKGPLPLMGTGLSNIKAAAEKYHGAMLMEQVEDTFHLHVLLNIS